MSDTAPPVIPGLRPEPRRDRYGRYLLAHPGTGELRPWTRATTLAHTLDDTHHLTQWKRRMVLQGIATDPTLLDGVASLVSDLKYADGYEARDLKKAIDERCDAAANAAGANDGSGWGTALHAVTEWFDAGRIDEIDVPIELLADLAAYEQCMTENGITRPTDHIERIVVNTTTDTAGTYDRLVKMPDGRILVGDLKTQQRIFDWLGIAIQLAQYAHADCVYNPDGTPSPLPDELDVTTGYGKPWVTNQHPRTVEDAGDGLMAAITLAPDVDTLTRLWNQAGPAGRWTDAHTDAAIHRKRQLAGREHARRELAAMRESAMRGAA
jgi:hypothetical protein